LENQKQKRIPFLKNEPEKLLKTQDWGQKTNRNEPENEVEKLLKIRSCGKNEPESEATDLVENSGVPKKRIGNELGQNSV